MDNTKEPVKLKELLYKDLDILNDDMFDAITNDVLLGYIKKYRMMILDIINVCKERNKF